MGTWVPEYLKVFVIETQTFLYLLRKYTPDDFKNLIIENEAPVISKISISQHGYDTPLKSKQLSDKTIGIPVSSYVKS